MEVIEYTALKYYNSCFSEECLYVGMLFHNLTTNTRVFKSIKNFRRLAAFDDEICVDFFRDYLNSIKAEVETNIFNIYSSFDLQEYIKPYVNELRFSTIRKEITNDPEFIDNMTKLFLKFDYDKTERLQKETEKKYIRKVLKSSNITYSDEPLRGKYDETIKFDFVTEDYGIKLFTFEGKTLSKLITTAKTWSYNAQEMKDKKKVVFLYDTDFAESKEFDIIIRILGESAHKVLPVTAGIEYILNNVS